MPSYAIRRDSGDIHNSGFDGDRSAHAPRVVVCIDKAGTSNITIPPAKAVAKALGAELEFIHVIEPHRHAGKAPFDPVEWDIARREAEDSMSKLAGEHAAGSAPISTRILEGRCAEQIGSALTGGGEDVAVLCRGHDEIGSHIGETARRILETGSSSLLIVPVDTKGPAKQDIARILVPLDGSGQSESAIPFALKIAASEDAEIVLVHATPEPNFTHIGPAEPGDEELRQAVNHRNERVAQKYLDRLCAHVRSGGVKVRTLVLGTGDVRRLLTSAVASESADLLVLASHGHGGFVDVPLGDVANFVLSRSAVPVLMVRRPRAHDGGHVFSGVRAKGARRPTASMQ
jgi:nucleotide-binding universal stress UspA family protein